MTDSLLVVLGDAVAGRLSRLRGGRLRFDYDDAYRERPAPTPLSLSMPVQVGSHPNRVVTPWLWGLLPDNEAVLGRWARELHVSTSPFSLLATPIGEDCAGAVRFLADGAPLERGGEVAWLGEEEVARRLRELREDSTAWLGAEFPGQFSLAGAQAKTALLFEEGRWGVPSGAIPTTHILKPAVGGLDDHDLNEHLCLAAARHAGLLAARSTIARFGEETAVVVSRYDRRPGADGIGRVHQEDLCQALAVPPARKYQNEGGPTPARIVRLLRDATPAAVAEQSVQRFADALIWNWLIGGTDAHAKNYSLLLAADQVRLAPLYDVASALPYGTHERKLRLAMKVGGSYDVYLRANHNPWPAAAAELGLEAGPLLARVAELAELAPGAFAAAAQAPAVVALGKELPARLLDLVTGRAERCLALLG